MHRLGLQMQNATGDLVTHHGFGWQALEEAVTASMQESQADPELRVLRPDSVGRQQASH